MTNPSSPFHRQVLPEGIVNTGLPGVQRTCDQVGLGLDPWQVSAARCILGKKANGSYAASTVVISIPRQVGKTYLIGALVFADCIVNPGTTVVWTAHRFPVSRESFNLLRGIANTPELFPHINPDDITTAAGNECIPFRNGSRILFKARERGAVRGFSNVRRLVLDEAQELTDATMADLLPTMNTATNPQVILTGTPPKPTDHSEAFTRLRNACLAGEVTDTLYLECSADDDADPDDPAARQQANPSLNARTPMSAIDRLRANLSEDDFRREVMGVWDSLVANSVIPDDTCAVLEDTSSKATGQLFLGVDINPDRTMCSVGLAGLREDNLFHLELVEQRKGTAWLPAWLEDRSAANPGLTVVLDGTPSNDRLLRDLRQRGVRVVVTNTKDLVGACAGLVEACAEGRVRHIGQPQLTSSLMDARKRPLAGGFAWNRRTATSDITPTVAVTLALFGLQKYAKPVQKSGGTTRPTRRRGAQLSV